MKKSSGRLTALFVMYAVLGSITAAIYLALWTDLGADERQALLRIIDQRLGLAIFALLAAIVALGMVLNGLYKSYIGAPLKLREKLLVLIESEGGMTLPEEGSRELRALARTINQLAEQRDAFRSDVLAQIRSAKASVEEEKNRLAVLVAELNQSVIVCNIDGRILLYNNRAYALFQPQASDDRLPAGTAPIGLGRSIFSVLERSLINHALETIEQGLRKGGPQTAAFVTGTASGQLIRARMALVLANRLQGRDAALPDAGEQQRTLNGYVLILDNITESVSVEGRRDAMLQALTEGSRAALASVRAAAENLLEYPDMKPHERDRFLRVVRDETCAMSRKIDDTAKAFSDVVKRHWPLEDMLGSDLVHAAQRRIEQRLGLPTKTEELADDLWLKVDSFSLLQGLTYLAGRLKEDFQVREVRFRLSREGRLAHLDLIWSGAVIGTETLMNWELEPMESGGATPSITLRDVVERHGGELWFQREKLMHRAYVRILIPATTPASTEVTKNVAGSGRPEYYDFDLFRQTDESRALEDRLLTQLSYTVFDTETTGLNPAAGDEIVQIGATRIVNGRLLTNECFDRLVNPLRPIPMAATRVHGIEDGMTRGEPGIDKVLPAFHAFCEDTVLVAHNAAFDMRFLQMAETRSGVVFHHPVIDTLLLSAVIHPHHDSHSLEDIAERLGVNILGRHTALGDAMVTGEIFLKMIPLLKEKGIRTLSDARRASERTYYAKVKY